LDVIEALVNLGKIAGVGSSGIVAMQTAKEFDMKRIRQALEVVLGGNLGHEFHEVIGHTLTHTMERAEEGYGLTDVVTEVPSPSAAEIFGLHEEAASTVETVESPSPGAVMEASDSGKLDVSIGEWHHMFTNVAGGYAESKTGDDGLAASDHPTHKIVLPTPAGSKTQDASADMTATTSEDAMKWHPAES
jgi:hypothetical protein